jgi:hypothetical protein
VWFLYRRRGFAERFDDTVAAAKTYFLLVHRQEKLKNGNAALKAAEAKKGRIAGYWSKSWG